MISGHDNAVNLEQNTDKNTCKDDKVKMWKIAVGQGVMEHSKIFGQGMMRDNVFFKIRVIYLQRRLIFWFRQGNRIYIRWMGATE